MWLLNVSTRKLEEFYGNNRPPYAILSHRWEREEVTFDQISQKPRGQGRGYDKIDQCCRKATSVGLQWVWIDTCCIDKKSSAELSEAINSMYRWYADAEICFAYLFDVKDREGMRNSSWFKRAWTLQELLAPHKLVFFNQDWIQIAKIDHETDSVLESEVHDIQVISDITGIPKGAFHSFQPASYSVAEKMSWAAGRAATREEDVAYSLLGIFQVNMSMLYGEGVRAFERLQEEIVRYTNDLSILAWSGPSGDLLAAEPARFVKIKELSLSEGFSLNNAGLSLKLFISPVSKGCYRLWLNNPSKIQTLRSGLSSKRASEHFFPRPIPTILLHGILNYDEGHFQRLPASDVELFKPWNDEDWHKELEIVCLCKIKIQRRGNDQAWYDKFAGPVVSLSPTLTVEANRSFEKHSLDMDRYKHAQVIEPGRKLQVEYPSRMTAGFSTYIRIMGRKNQDFHICLGITISFQPCCLVSMTRSAGVDSLREYSESPPEKLDSVSALRNMSPSEMLSTIHDIEKARATAQSGGIHIINENGVIAYRGTSGKYDASCVFEQRGLKIQFFRQELRYYVTITV